MGICLTAYAISDRNIAEALSDPALIWRVVESEDESAYLRELKAGPGLSFLSRLFGKAKPTLAARRLNFEEHEMRLLDLDKSWDGLNACLKACVPHAPNFFEGTGQVGKIEVGYGPALYHRSETMAYIADAYMDLSEEQVLAAFQTLDLKDVYLSGLWARRDQEAKSYLTENLAELQAFVQHTAKHALGAIIQLT